MLQIVASLNDNSRGIIYDRNIFIMTLRTIVFPIEELFFIENKEKKLGVALADSNQETRESLYLFGRITLPSKFKLTFEPQI
jgi:hypothetical protein